MLMKNKHKLNYTVLYFSIFWGRIFDKSDLAEFLGPSFCKDPEPSEPQGGLRCLDPIASVDGK